MLPKTLEYNIFLLKIHKCSEKNYVKFVDDLDYYMLTTSKNKKVLYYFLDDESFYIMLRKNSIWSIELLQFLIENDLRGNSEYSLFEVKNIHNDSEFMKYNINMFNKLFEDIPNTRLKIKEDNVMRTRVKKLDCILEKINKDEE
jgi:hypothetical protein